MENEAREIVFGRYDKLSGREDLYLVKKQYDIKKKKNKGRVDGGYLQFTDLEKRFKLNRMTKTFEFTRVCPMLFHYMETLMTILIS
jgi:hypothetical protein